MNERIDTDGTLVLIKEEITPSRQKKLDALQRYLVENREFTDDPIQFIRIHYEGDKEKNIIKMSLEQLRGFLYDKGVDYKTAEGLRQLLEALGIERRDKGEKTESGGENSGNNPHNQSLASQNHQAFKAELLRILDADKLEVSPEFSLEVYNGFQFGIEKALYLLRLSPDNLKSIANITQLGKKSITNSINFLLGEIKEKFLGMGIKIDIPIIQTGSIGNLLKKLEN